MSDVFRSLELFAGGGGLACGLERAGFQHVGLIERDRHSCGTLRANAGGAARWCADQVHEVDIRDFVFDPYTDIDLLAAGVPCQPFSMGGVHRGNDDTRNLFPHALEAVRRTRPRAVMIENVRGLSRPGFQPYFEYIHEQLRFPHIQMRSGESWEAHCERLKRARLQDAGGDDERYMVEWRLINAANFGVPQRRLRVIIQAIRCDVSDEVVWPMATHSEALLVQAQADGSYWQEFAISQRSNEPLLSLGDSLGVLGKTRWLTVRDILEGLPEASDNPESAPLDSHYFVPGARSYPGHTGSPLDEPAKTLKAGVHGVPGGEGTVILDDGSVRYMTIREAARIQTFEDDYRFVGARSERMRQIGNAVPVKLAEVFGSIMSGYLIETRVLAGAG